MCRQNKCRWPRGFAGTNVLLLVQLTSGGCLVPRLRWSALRLSPVTWTKTYLVQHGWGFQPRLACLPRSHQAPPYALPTRSSAYRFPSSLSLPALTKPCLCVLYIMKNNACLRVHTFWPETSGSPKAFQAQRRPCGDRAGLVALPSFTLGGVK